jgi:hypothetical protein
MSKRKLHRDSSPAIIAMGKRAEEGHPITVTRCTGLSGLCKKELLTKAGQQSHRHLSMPVRLFMAMFCLPYQVTGSVYPQSIRDPRCCRHSLDRRRPVDYREVEVVAPVAVAIGNPADCSVRFGMVDPSHPGAVSVTVDQ